MLSIMLRTDSRANTKTFYTASDCSTSENRLFCAVQMLLFIYLFIYLRTQHSKQYKIEDTIKAAKF